TAGPSEVSNCMVCFYSVLFFFQAEDGIRDFHVTGVQTCALPISADISANSSHDTPSGSLTRMPCCTALRPPDIITSDGLSLRSRSEERRVGKECRSRWWRDH